MTTKFAMTNRFAMAIGSGYASRLVNRDRVSAANNFIIGA